MKDIVIMGTGGCARELQWLLEDNNTAASQSEKWNIVGFIECSPSKGAAVNGIPVYSDEWLVNQEHIAVACGLGGAALRKRVVEKLIAQNAVLEFPTLISRRAVVSERVEIGKGCIICAGAVVTCDITMGDFVIVNMGSIITHDAVIGDFTQINLSCSLSGGVKIGACVQIGTGVKMIPQVSVGDGAVLGAGAVVIRDIPAGCTAVGCPTKVIRRPVS